jgi:hypothetical protein
MNCKRFPGKKKLDCQVCAFRLACRGKFVAVVYTRIDGTEKLKGGIER